MKIRVKVHGPLKLQDKSLILYQQTFPSCRTNSTLTISFNYWSLLQQNSKAQNSLR